MAQERIDDALERLEAAETVPSALEAVPRALCAACGFDNALFSRVSGAVWIPMVAHRGVDVSPLHAARLVRFAQGGPVPLSASPVEAAVARRREPALVAAADRIHHPGSFTGGISTRAHVLAPLVGARGVFGLLHADAPHRLLVENDRDALQAFATGLATVLERLHGAERLGQRRADLAGAFSRALHDVAHLADERRAGELLGQARGPAHPLDRIDRLTRRQREVLELLATGATNASIVQQLTVADSTVASHVKQILRKLEVANRASAVSFYLRAMRRRELG